jgi:hypothetical protein
MSEPVEPFARDEPVEPFEPDEQFEQDEQDERDEQFEPDEPFEPDDLAGLLFRLTGRVPDDGLAIMRTCVADGELGEAVEMLATALQTGRLPLTADEAEVARSVLRSVDFDPGLADLADELAELPEPPYTFRAVPAGDAAGDPVDNAAVASAGLVGGLRGLWRVDRTSPRATARVRLAEAEPGADLLELTAEMQHGITEAGEVPPRVEVFAAGADLPPYHRAALAAAELVWIEPTLPEPQLVRVFDGADPTTGPFFRADHPRMDGADRDRLLDYLRAGEMVLSSFGFLDDLLDPEAIGAVPVSFRSDGLWVWTDTVSYYLDRHHLAPDPELIAHVLGAQGPPPRLSWLERHRAMRALAAPEEEPAWQPG